MVIVLSAAIALVLGLFAAVAYLVDEPAGCPASREVKSGFSMRHMVVLVGDRENDDICRAQRRRLKPVVDALRAEGASIAEVYGDATPRVNGVAVEWLDGELLRAVIGAEDGFRLVYFDKFGRQTVDAARPVAAGTLVAQPAFQPVRSANDEFAAAQAA